MTMHARRFLQRQWLAAALACWMCASPAWCAEDRIASPFPPAQARAQMNFFVGNWRNLERDNERLRHGAHIDAEGLSELQQFRDGVDNVIFAAVKDREAYLNELEAFTAEWTAAHPASPLAHVLHARVLLARGCFHAGLETEDEQSSDDVSRSQAYLRRAADYLAAHAEVAMQDSFAHDTLLLIGRSLGWPSDRMRAALEAGLLRNPDDTQLYFTMLISLLPQAGGDARVLDDYIRDVARRSKDGRNMAMYARLYWDAATGEYGDKLFEDTLADWGAVKRGFDALLAHYPDSTAFLNGYAYMACLASDKPKMVSLFARIGKRLDPSQWGADAEQTIETCQRRAREG